MLYGITADVPGALAEGVNVALAPDWTESGSPQLLAELKVAKQVNQSLWSGVITPFQLVEFVTRNAAAALGIDDRFGQIKPGYAADLMIVPGNPGDPYRALLDSEPVDVLLTVVNGRPMYGEPHLMEQFTFLADLEDVIVAGERRSLAIQIKAHAIPESERSFSEIYATLEEAYLIAEPKICEFLGLGRELKIPVYLPLLVH
jgi:hypothetical protein